MKLYKFLAPGRLPCHGGLREPWPEPGEWTFERKPVPCVSGWHLVSVRHLRSWLGPELWEAEGEGLVNAGDKLVARRACLLSRVDTWDERAARLFAADCAERVVHLTGPDERCLRAIAAARAFADGGITRDELRAAAYAAYAADAAAAAAYAAYAADAATAACAAYAATAAAYAAAGADAAAAAAEREWQAQHLAEMLGLPFDA